MNRYVLYARKSHEDENRQQRSIGDQIQNMTDLANRWELTVVRTIHEERSAKEPYQRPLFDQMVRMLQEGEADSILSYHVNRLARNMVEAGLLQHLLTKNVIKEIRTASEVFKSGDNILPFILQTATSTQYSLDLVNIVRDRLSAKVARGEYPQRAPEGYKNNPFRHTIEKDEERFPLIQKAWELMATESYSLGRLTEVMNQQWGYTTRQAYKVGGRPMTKSLLHRIFHNVFYTGFFLYNGELHQGAHEPMIDWDTYEKVQRRLSRNGTTRPQRRGQDFPFTDLILCGVCGRRVTAEHKRGRLKRGDYVYYHCAGYQKCGQKAVRQEVIEDAITDALNAVAVSPRFRPQCVEAIERIYREETDKDQAQMEQHHRGLEEAEKKMRRLVQMKLSDLLTDEEFVSEKAALQGQINGLKKDAASAQGELERARDGTLAVLDFVTKAPMEFTVGSAARKREIARQLGAVFELKNRKIRLEIHPLLVPIMEMSPQSPTDGANRDGAAKTGAIEPLEIGSGTAKRTSEKSAVLPGCPEGTFIEPFRKVFDLLRDPTIPRFGLGPSYLGMRSSPKPKVEQKGITRVNTFHD